MSDLRDVAPERPTLGRIVHYRSRTAKYTLAAIVSATVDTLYRVGVEEGNLPDLDDDMHIHLAVFTPGVAGRWNSTTPKADADAMRERSTPAGGTYQEWNVAYDPTGETGGTWMWPPRV